VSPPAGAILGPWGWYGKAPGRGDFIRRGLTPGFVAVWDAWMQRLIRTARDALGPRWREGYFTAPIRRFALSPGLCGPRGAVGVMMPSVDRVGRMFPLCLAAETEAPAPAAWRAAAPHFEALETAALAMLDPDAAPELLARALSAPALSTPALPAPALWAHPPSLPPRWTAPCSTPRWRRWGGAAPSGRRSPGRGCCWPRACPAARRRRPPCSMPGPFPTPTPADATKDLRPCPTRPWRFRAARARAPKSGAFAR